MSEIEEISRSLHGIQLSHPNFDSSSEKSNLIVNYLPHDVDENSLKALFSEHGEILSVKVVRDKTTKKSLGFGFVKFATESEAIDALTRKNGLTIGIKKLKVSFARLPSDDIRDCKLYVTNLPREYSEREVYELFKCFGEIIECRVLKDSISNTYKGVAFVQFNLKKEATNSLSLNGHCIAGHDRPLSVKFAEDQHKKKAAKAMMMMMMGPSSYPQGGLVGMGVNGMIPMGLVNMGTNQRDTVSSPSSSAPAMNLSISPSRTDISGDPNTYFYPAVFNSTHGMQVLSPAPVPQHYQLSVGTQYTPLYRPAQSSNQTENLPYQLSVQSYPQQSQSLTPQYSTSSQPTSPYESPSTSSYSFVPRNSVQVKQEPPSSFHVPGSVNVGVSNLPPIVDQSYLTQLFGAYGKVSGVTLEGLAQDGSGSARAVIQFSSLSDAQNAVRNLNQTALGKDGSALQVSISFPRRN